MNILDRVKLVFARGGSPDEKRPDDITSKKSPMQGTCCSAPTAEKQSCCAEGECDCS